MSFEIEITKGFLVSLQHLFLFNTIQYNFHENSYVCLKNSAGVIEDQTNFIFSCLPIFDISSWENVFHRNGQSMEDCSCGLPGAVYHD